MAARYELLSSQEERLPDGMQRIGYDSDTQTYTFRDHSDGTLWESEPGARDGLLHRAGILSRAADVRIFTQPFTHMNGNGRLISVAGRHTRTSPQRRLALHGALPPPHRACSTDGVAVLWATHLLIIGIWFALSRRLGSLSHCDGRYVLECRTAGWG